MASLDELDDIDGFPDTLYKYRCWNDREESKFHKTLLTQNEFFFAEPLSFNDPFDSQVTVRLEAKEEDMYQILMERSEDFYSDKSYSEREQLVTQRILELTRPGYLEEEKERQRQETNRGFGIFSLAGTRDSLVMWAHYAGSHKGICVGFDKSALLEFSANLYQEKEVASFFTKMDYVEDYPIINLLDKEHKRGTAPYTVIKTKSVHWRYEDEYRFFIIGKEITERKHEFPDSIIAEVILGCKMEDVHKEEIKAILRAKGVKIKLLQAKLRDHSFGLDFEEIDY